MTLLRNYPDWFALAGFGLLFALAPEIDLWVSNWFFYGDQGFVYNRSGIFRFIHEVIPLVGYVMLVGLTVAAAVTLLRKQWLGIRRPQALYLALVFTLGPVVLVNFVLKDQLGRPRPVDVQNFGGEHEYAGAFEYSAACPTNCSFVSGHAAVGFFLCALCFVGPRHRHDWLLAGLVLGSLVGLSRVVEGKHFVSDVVFAFFAVYFMAKLVRAVLVTLWPRHRPLLACEPAPPPLPPTPDTSVSTLLGVGAPPARRGAQPKLSASVSS